MNGALPKYSYDVSLYSCLNNQSIWEVVQSYCVIKAVALGI